MNHKPAGHPGCLVPFDHREAISLKEAAGVAGCSVGTIKNRCSIGIGRKIGGQWRVSRVALAMLLDDNRHALKAYLDGERHGVVADYFARVMPTRAKQNQQ